MKTKIFFILTIIVFLFSSYFSSLATADDFAIDNPKIPHLLVDQTTNVISSNATASNITEQTVIDWGFIKLSNITQAFIQALGFYTNTEIDANNLTMKNYVDWVNTTNAATIYDDSWINSTTNASIINKIESNNQSMISYVLYVNSTNTGGTGSNPFNQSLNTTDAVVLKNITTDWICFNTACTVKTNGTVRWTFT